MDDKEQQILETLLFLKEKTAYFGEKEKKAYPNLCGGAMKRLTSQELERTGLEEPSNLEGQSGEEESLGKTGLLHLFFVFFMCSILAFSLAYGTTHYIGHHTMVCGTSMEDTLWDGDCLFLNKLSYHFREPERFDIIVFPFDEKQNYIKRIIGLPGETVWIEDSVIYIDGKELKEPYGKEAVENPGLLSQKTEIGAGEYLVLGDNRNNSEDSRFPEVGLIKRKEILGKADFRLYPFKRFGRIE